MGCRGDSASLRSRGNTTLGQTDWLVAQTRWGIPSGHMADVRFATREPVAVLQTVIYAPLFCTFSGVKMWQKSGETQWRTVFSAAPFPPPHRPHDTHVNSPLSLDIRCVIAWVACSWVTVELYNMFTKEAQPTTSSGVSLTMCSGTTSRRE